MQKLEALYTSPFLLHFFTSPFIFSKQSYMELYGGTGTLLFFLRIYP